MPLERETGMKEQEWEKNFSLYTLLYFQDF